VPDVSVAVLPDTGDGQVNVTMDRAPPTTGPDGAFRIETPAGKGMLLVLTQPTPTMRPGLVLTAGKTLDVGAIAIAATPVTPPPPEPPAPAPPGPPAP
jgi:hypothetical protein